MGIEKARKIAYFRAFLAFLSCRLSLAELRCATSGFEAVLLTFLHTRIAGQEASLLQDSAVLIALLQQGAAQTVADTASLHFATAANKIGNGLDEQLENFIKEHPDTKLVIIDTMQKIREVGGEAYSYASDYEIIGKLKQFADKHCICVLTVHHTRKQPAGDSFEMISGTTGLLGCADGSLLMQKKKRTALEATIDVVGRDQQDQILYLKKDADTQIWKLEKVENELHKEPPDHVLDAVAGLLSAEHPIWTGSPSALADAVHVGMAANALSKYLNVKSGRLLDEYHVRYENKVRHEGRRITLTYDAESK